MPSLLVSVGGTRTVGIPSNLHAAVIDPRGLDITSVSWSATIGVVTPGIIVNNTQGSSDEHYATASWVSDSPGGGTASCTVTLSDGSTISDSIFASWSVYVPPTPPPEPDDRYIYRGHTKRIGTIFRGHTKRIVRIYRGHTKRIF